MLELLWFVLCEVGCKDVPTLYFPHWKQNSKLSISSPLLDKQKVLDSALHKGKKKKKWGSDVSRLHWIIVEFQNEKLQRTSTQDTDLPSTKPAMLFILLIGSK